VRRKRVQQRRGQGPTPRDKWVQSGGAGPGLGVGFRGGDKGVVRRGGVIPASDTDEEGTGPASSASMVASVAERMASMLRISTVSRAGWWGNLPGPPWMTAVSQRRRAPSGAKAILSAQEK
jgi:hypothetical protein